MKTQARMILTTLSGLLLSQVSPARADDSCECDIAPQTETYRLRVLSRATTSSCGADESFTHRVVLCAPEGCVAEDVSNASRLTFKAASGESIKVESHGVTGGTAATEAPGVARNTYTAGETGRFTQTVQAGRDCLRSVVFELSRVPS